MKNKFIFLLCYGIVVHAGAQIITFLPPKMPVGDTITALRFYISNIQLCRDGKIVYAEPDSYHLIDFSDTAKCRLTISSGSQDFNQLRFILGIDSATNVSGAMGGALDPINGMYWSWQSGYINVKIEGAISKENHIQKIELHLGGYSPVPSSCTVMLAIKDQQHINIQPELQELFKKIRAGISASIMSPGPAAAELSKIFAASFKIAE